jgi:hypothetical protein
LQLAVTYTLWIPDGVTTIRCVIVHQHGASIPAAQAGATAAYDLHWQALAEKWDCALLGPSYHVLNDATDASPGGAELWFDPRRGSEKTFLKALNEFATKSGHPEIATAPWCLWGHSGGGIWADVMATLHPSRVIAIFLRSGTAAMFRSRSEFAQPQVPGSVYAIPIMANAGVAERPRGPWTGSIAIFQEYRAKGAPIGFAPDPRTGHETGDSRYLAIPFFDACLAMRLPDKGSKSQNLKPVDMSKAWLAPLLGETAVPAASYKGNPLEAVWLPNEQVAKIWMEYVKNGTVGDVTPPPPPFDVRVISRGGAGNEITWDAEADFESGIGGFFVMRDARVLARLPVTAPPVVYGRPLFQGLSYHDTPEGPLPDMRYVDASAKPGEKHTYTVITVNSAGVRSEPSAEAHVPPPVTARYVPFEGEKTTWHEGFDRYNFIMDDASEAITQIKAPVAEVASFGIDTTLKDGKRRCVVVVPKNPAAGYPWSWRGCYWNHQPQTEVELLKRGFHIAFVAPDPGGQGKAWDAWYKFLTEEHGLAKKAAFIGMSKGGVNEFNWGVANPDKVACIYADNPALYDEDFAKIPVLAKNDIPLLHICGSEDMLLQRHTLVIEEMYHQLGGSFTLIIKEGQAHHPHSLQDPKPIADWIVAHLQPSNANRPAFVDANFTKSYYYSLEPAFIYLKEEQTYATARGPGFTESYDRYDSSNAGTFNTAGMTIIVPRTVAPGKPWVFRAGAIDRDATVDQALLAKGFHIVIPPLPLTAQAGTGADQWSMTYKTLVDNGFSKKPVLEGTGAKAGEAYAWAIANPDKVSCIYARNPFMHSVMAKSPLIDNLAPLAKAGVPILHDCGSLDPWLNDQTRVVEKRYKELTGQIWVIIRAGEGHFPLSPKDPTSVVEFILNHQR